VSHKARGNRATPGASAQRRNGSPEHGVGDSEELHPDQGPATDWGQLQRGAPRGAPRS